MSRHLADASSELNRDSTPIPLLLVSSTTLFAVARRSCPENVCYASPNWPLLSPRTSLKLPSRSIGSPSPIFRRRNATNLPASIILPTLYKTPHFRVWCCVYQVAPKFSHISGHCTLKSFCTQSRQSAAHKKGFVLGLLRSVVYALRRGVRTRCFLRLYFLQPPMFFLSPSCISFSFHRSSAHFSLGKTPSLYFTFNYDCSATPCRCCPWLWASTSRSYLFSL